jgi:hypothetical protein
VESSQLRSEAGSDIPGELPGVQVVSHEGIHRLSAGWFHLTVASPLWADGQAPDADFSVAPMERFPRRKEQAGNGRLRVPPILGDEARATLARGIMPSDKVSANGHHFRIVGPIGKENDEIALVRGFAVVLLSLI